jgi:predicted metal-dependent hydrolase
MDDEQFLRGVEQFNQGFYFECHDTLEDLWHDTRGHDRLYLQGLIQISVGFHHFFNQNYKGATSQLTKGLGKLDGYRPSHRGIELELFSREVVYWLAMAERALRGEEPEIEDARIPKLQRVRLHHLEEN